MGPTFDRTSPGCDPNGRTLIVIGCIKNVTYTLVNVHIPNEDPNLDTTNQAYQTQASRGYYKRKLANAAKLRKLFHMEGLYDIWRTLYPTAKDYTYYAPAYKEYSRINMFLTDATVLQQVTDITISPISWLDLGPVVMTIEGDTQSNRTYSWKLAPMLLIDPDFHKMIQKAIQVFFKDNDTPNITQATKWCEHKATIRGLLIQQSSRIQKQKAQVKRDLWEKLTTLTALNKKNPTGQRTSEIQDLRNQLKTIEMAKCELALRSLKLEHYYKGSRASDYLAKQVKKQRAKSSIVKLTQHGKTLYNPKDIANAFAEY
ncbi:hypothetical protein XELAEV_18024998mg [Xenopus laevis]|uniref:Uncharacterized protein n=1 Tax=Xenopus laevis TaxID=8355 RepID=A0A974D1A9_XENLA|nr:hypothetical protein XELAEV_18024998mg [Xenopus laevis]